MKRRSATCTLDTNRRCGRRRRWACRRRRSWRGSPSTARCTCSATTTRRAPGAYAAGCGRGRNGSSVRRWGSEQGWDGKGVAAAPDRRPRGDRAGRDHGRRALVDLPTPGRAAGPLPVSCAAVPDPRPRPAAPPGGPRRGRLVGGARRRRPRARGLARAPRAGAARTQGLRCVQPHRADRAGGREALPPRRRPGRIPGPGAGVARARHGTVPGGARVADGRGDDHGVRPDDAQPHDGLPRHGAATRPRPRPHDNRGGVHLHPLGRRREARGGGARGDARGGGGARVTSQEPRTAEEARERLDRIRVLIEEGREDNLPDLLSEFHPSDLADLIEELDEADRVRVLEMLPADIASETLAEMEREERPEELLASLDPTRIGELIAELSDDDAVNLIRDLDPEDQARVLAALPNLEAGLLRRLLRYDEES